MARRVGARPKGAQAPARFLWAQLVVVAAFVLLSARLWQLQVLSGEHYFRRSADNFVKELELPAPRGQLLDRRGRVLADNRPSYDVYVTPRFVTERSLARLGELLLLSEAQRARLLAKVSSKKGLERFRPLLALADVERDQMALLETESLELPGVQVSATAHRSYPHGTLGAHVIGYMNQISAAELVDRREQGYRTGELVGRSGLERQWESFLRGKDGVERVVVDAKGQRKQGVELAELAGIERRLEAIPGHNVVTSLDLDLMRVTEAALKKHRSGAAVAIEVDSGRVLALLSWPAPDPNLLTGRLSRAQSDRLNKDPTRPLLDKALRENYFPGSTFKVVPLLAALADGVADPAERIPCHGSFQFGRRAFHCVEAHGLINLSQALAESCNVYFYQLGDRLGIDRMAEVAHELGFGAPTGLGLNGEVSGFIPTMASYRRRGGFQKGFVLNTAIGQGSVKATVLQVAMAYAALANGGRLLVPQLVERVETPSGKVVQAFAPRLRRVLSARPEHLALARRALHDAVYDPKGTAFAARLPGYDVAGKTGTAQLHKNRRGETSELDEQNDHAWFAAFAPTHHAKIAVAVLVEHGGFGAKAAAPVAMEMLRGYFEKVEVSQGAALATGQGAAEAAGRPAPSPTAGAR